MGKKIKIKVEFDDIIFSPDTKSSENVELLTAFFGEVPIIRQWSDEERFIGTPRGFNYLDHISLQLCTQEKDELKSILSSWSNYQVSVDNFTETSKLSIALVEGKVVLNGEIFVQLGIKDVVRPDFLHYTKRLQLTSMSFRVKDSGDLITVKKFGANWELESQTKSAYIIDESDDYIKDCPKVEVILS
jgi:hypothetical protein